MIIKIPFKTPSINHLYGHTKFGSFYLKPEAKKLREKIREVVYKKKWILPIDTKLSIGVEIHENWLTKKGEVKIKDIANREKFLIDSIFEALGIDDKFIFEQKMLKVQDEKEFALIRIEKK